MSSEKEVCVKDVIYKTPAPKKVQNDSVLHDSGFISPPTVVKFDLSTSTSSSTPYNLRHLPGQTVRWSSTPLPILKDVSMTTPALLKTSSSSPNISNNSPVTQMAEILDFQKRLDVLEQPEYDSGFDSLISDCSVSRTPVAEKDEASRNPTNTSPIRSLGAIPKRRSPRHHVTTSRNHVDVERFTRRKAQMKKSFEVLEQVSITTPIPEHCYNVLHNVDKRISKEGRDTCDVVRHLSEMNLSHVLSSIFSHLASEDLCKFAQVSQVWRQSLLASTTHDERRQEYLAKMKIERENFGAKLQFGPKRTSPRRVLKEMVNIKNQTSPTSVKRDRNPSLSTIISPSKIRHKLFVDQAKTLTPGERLVHCPLCTSPSRVSILSPSTPTSANLQSQKAECSSPKCQFQFCPDCQCGEHPGLPCRTTRGQTSTRSSKNGGVTSKKSKARLRRL